MPIETAIHNAYMSARGSMAKMLSRLVPPKEVDDILQDTYVRLCQVGKPEQIQHPKSYLYRTARNLALDSLKRAENRVTEPWTEEFESSRDLAGLALDETYEQAASSEEFGHFCEAVRQLPVQARRVFVLKKVYGYSQREIASELRLAESTVEKHIALAVRRCAIYMQEQAWRESGEDNRKEVRGE